MAHAIGCLGTPIAVTVCRRERAKRAERGVRLAVPKRNQTRTMLVAAVTTTPGRFRLLPVREGHLRHVRAAMFYHEAQYLHKLK